MPDHPILKQLSEAVIALDRDAVGPLAQKALDEGIAPHTIIVDGISAGMQVIGQRFKTGEVFLPEVLVACDAYYAGLNVVRPKMKKSDRKHFLGTIVMGTIYGDIHTVGKDVAIPIFEAAGFDVVDLGIAVPNEKYVEAVRKHKPQIVGLGTYMTSTFMHTKETVAALKAAGLRDKVKIICGGPSVNPEAAREMGADDASDNAWEAVEKMKALLEQLKREQGGDK